jgi:hypothetical protein
MNPINHLEWRNLNAGRNYPFLDGSSLIYDGGFIPQSWIVDARIYARGNYSESQPCYISKLTRTNVLVALEVSSSSGFVLGEAIIKFSENRDTISIFDGEILTGCLVIDPLRSLLLQSIDEGEYDLTPTTATFLPAVCEYLPETQVQSINGKTANVTLTGNEGIKVERIDSSTIKISVLGDPHFIRYGCVVDSDSAPADVLDLNSVFLKNLTIVHYVKNTVGQMVGPYASKLKKRPDGSVVLALKTKKFQTGDPTVADMRPAFRITAEGNSLIFSMAGG